MISDFIILVCLRYTARKHITTCVLTDVVVIWFTRNTFDLPKSETLETYLLLGKSRRYRGIFEEHKYITNKMIIFQVVHKINGRGMIEHVKTHMYKYHLT